MTLTPPKPIRSDRRFIMSGGKSGIILLRRNYFRSVDYWLVIPILLLSLIGIYVLNKVLSSGFDDYPSILYRQAAAAVLGMAIALFICLIDTHFLKAIGWIIYIASILLLLLVFVDNFSMVDQWGADSWLNLPFIGTFQPSEIAKIGMIIVTAYYLEAIKNKEITIVKGFMFISLVDGLPLLMILRQPDFGTAMVIIFALMCMIFIWGIKYRYLFLGISAVIVGVIPILWNFVFTSIQKSRILSFVFAGSDPKGEYNLIQAKKAIASGGLIGNRTGEVVNVPVKWADFIYTAISEHMGFIGTTMVVILAFFFLTRSIYVASKASQKSYTYTVIGLAGAFAFHYIESMGMSVGLLPITGIPLPFISLGGSALLVNFISFGIILNISMERSIERN